MRSLSTILMATAALAGTPAAAAPLASSAKVATAAGPATVNPPERYDRPHEPRSATPGPASRVAVATAAARVEPDPGAWLNATQVYGWSEGALYQVYAAPGRVTDIALQPGEQLAGSGPVAAGDTVRWIIGDTTSGAGPTQQVHVLVKPTGARLSTNLVINTDRRTYHLELRATPETWMASVSWRYPQDELLAVRAATMAAARAEPVAKGVDLERLSFDYRIEGAKTPWRPLRVFDDGRQVFIEFPPQIATGEMPPLFVLGAEGTADLVNYRVSGRRMIVDRMFDVAELRLGGPGAAKRVRIVRVAAR